MTICVTKNIYVTQIVFTSFYVGNRWSSDSMTSEQLVQEYGPYVNKLVFRMVRNRSFAEDISQDIWLEILKSIPTFKGESKVSTWIYTIASRIVIKRSLAEKSLSDEEFDEFFSVPLQYHVPPSVEKEMWVRDKCDRCVTSFLRVLSHDERLVLLLHDLLELDYTHISEITGITEQTLRKQVSRSRTKIHSCLHSVCPLVGDKGTCRCHIKREVHMAQIDKSFAKFKTAYEKANELTLLEMTFPTKNYWEKFI